MGKTKVVMGQKYGFLTPTEIVGRNKHGLLLYKCSCDCGNVTTVGSRYLTEGKTVSCGCKRAKQNGLSDSITYKSWISAKQRCTNPHNHNYKNYGARGITMCEEWLKSFSTFLQDMGERPSIEYTLDRIDVNGDYEPNNCRWATHKQQSNNRRDNVIIYVDGVYLTVAQFTQRYKLNRSNVDYELRRNLSPDEIVKKYSDVENLKIRRREISKMNLLKVGLRK